MSLPLPTPTFGGQAVFGAAVAMVTGRFPREAQLNNYFGLDGVERLDGGDRGAETRVTGLLSGWLKEELASKEAALATLRDGTARTLVDTLGRSWDDVILDRFTPKGRIRQDVSGRLFREYEALFIHLRGGDTAPSGPANPTG